MKPQSVTVEILKGIRADIQSVRDEMQAFRGDVRDEFRSTHVRLDTTRDNLSRSIDALRNHVVESELRTATAITDLAGSVRELTSVLSAQSDLRPRVERCEGDIAQIKQRLPASRGR